MILYNHQFLKQRLANKPLEDATVNECRKDRAGSFWKLPFRIGQAVMLGMQPLSAAVLIATIGLVGSAAAAERTAVELVNATNADDTLTDVNVSGTLTPAPPNPLRANTGSFLLYSETAGTADAGVLTYRTCRFNWSKIRTGNTYAFSLGAKPSPTCESKAIAQDPLTGEYRIKFTITR